nr:hypothetical protein [Myxococcota bacterium]
TISRGIAPPGYAIAVEPRGGEARVLCEPDCELSVPPRTELRVGHRRGAGIEWTGDLRVDRDLRLDVRIQDHSAIRGFAYALLIVAGVLVGATAIVGIATEPEPPELGWFGGNHALVFAGIAGGIVIALGVPGVGIALAFERDTPALEIVPEDRAPME